MKELASKNGYKDQCSLCGKVSGEVIHTSSSKFIKTIKGLLRYYYSESEYHSKLGGESFSYHLSGENPILKFSNKFNKLEKEDFLLSFLEELEQDKDILLYTAYGRDIYNYPPMTAVSVGKSSILGEIKSKLIKLNYYQVEDEFESRLASIATHIETKLNLGECYYRARIGSVLKASNFDWRRMMHEEEFHVPYQGDEIAAPPIHLATGGRINRPGVSYLYLATDSATAISEVRPHPGENVSVGKFKANRKLKIADFSQHTLTDELLSDDGLDTLELIIAIENNLSMAVSPSMSKHYSVTQFIAEIVRKQGFDGLSFKSSVSEGKNYVIFNPEMFDWVDNSGEVFKINAVSYSSQNQLLFNPEEDYDLIRD
ncbi:RES family NAD+ phosphorylase [Pseudoalteromonas arctica]|uniref:RES family NAD+ phosphorylase n=1 Tax=Pseudoalteromonas arctica TaxID=394751 RepID=UPI00145C2AA7|nr:RES family NAD+ phosphorylase [Pseudoalteromonas arctica]NMP80011.1 RES family NAD+ phosphorylase [Pseudoalteromonas arctica]